MNKVTKRLLVACVAALAVGACQDSVTIVEPAPPPPPPPTPGVDATVTIQGLRNIPLNQPVNPTAVFGDINVVLNVEEGDNTVTQIDLVWNGAAIGCETVNTNTVPSGEGLSLSTSGSADDVECFWNTDAANGVCAGVQLTPLYGNETANLGARITLDDGTTRDAANVQVVTLVNSDFIMVVHHDAGDANGQGVIGTNGRRFWGGPADLDGDMTDDNTLQYAACPVSYEGIMVGELFMQGLTDVGPQHVDLGAGPGVAEADDTSPFVWTADPDDNLGVEDSPATGDDGHSIFTTGSIFDDAGLNVTADFGHGTLLATLAEPLVAPDGMYLDFTAPAVAAGSEIEVDGAAVAGGEWFSVGDFGVTGVTDPGVGFTFGSAAGSQIDVGECDVADNIDNDATTDFTAIDTDYENVDGIDDHAEDDPSDAAGDDDGFGNPDAGGVACYVAEVTELTDDLRNAVDLETVLGGDAINTGDPRTFYGADRTMADITNMVPDATVLVLNPDASANNGISEATGLPGDDCADAGDCVLDFDAADVELESTDPGSAVDETACLAGGPCTNVVADLNTAPAAAPATSDVDNVNTNSTDKGGADDDFQVDLGFASGGATFPDGDYEIEITVPDFAIFAPNEATHTWTFSLDDTGPVIGALDPAPVGSGGTDANAIVMSIGETIDDAHIIDDADLSVWVVGSDATGAGWVAETCAAPGGAGLYLLDETATVPEIDRNGVALENGTNAIDFSGTTGTPEAFNIPDPFGPATATTTVRYCFVLTAEDAAVLADGTDQGNVSTLVTQIDVTWNANP